MKRPSFHTLKLFSMYFSDSCYRSKVDSGICGEGSGDDEEVREDEPMCGRNIGIRVRVPGFKFLLNAYNQFRTISLVYRQKTGPGKKNA